MPCLQHSAQCAGVSTFFPNEVDGQYRLGLCRNLPYDGGAKGEKKKVRLPKKHVGVTTNIYLRKMLEKTKKRSTNFENKGSGVVCAWGRY